MELYGQWYGTGGDYRTQLEEKIKQSWGPLPVIFRIDLLRQMAQAGVEQREFPEALRLAEEAAEVLKQHVWPAETELPLRASLAAIRYQAGQKDSALQEAANSEKLYEAKRGSIVNIRRAGVVRAFAEAYQKMEQPAAALGLYKKAVLEGIENPNSRPRAEDLSATCRSMALCAVEPDSELWGQLRRIYKDLGHPW